MKTLAAVKKDLEFNRGLSSLIEVLKTVAVAQFRALEQKISSFKKLVLAIESFFHDLDPAKVNHPFLAPQNNLQAVVAVTSDSGLLGGLNMQVIATALLELKNSPGKLIVIGERGKVYLKEANIAFVAFSGIKDDQRYGQASQLRDYLLSRVIKGSFGALKIVYPHPVSFTVQRVETVALLPFAASTVESQIKKASYSQTIFESSPADILEYLIYTWVAQRFYEIFGLSRLAEFAARFVHLEASHQRIREIDAKTRLEYFRIRHEIIDRNMRELFASRALFAAS
jgi:ATP synthase F1 gamma subunit